MQRYLTELSSYLPSVSSFEFGNVFSILFDSVYGGPAPRPDAHDVGRAGSGTPRAGAFTGRQAVRSMKATRRAAAIGRMRVRRVCVGWRDAAMAAVGEARLRRDRQNVDVVVEFLLLPGYLGTTEDGRRGVSVTSSTARGLPLQHPPQWPPRPVGVAHGRARCVRHPVPGGKRLWCVYERWSEP